MVKRMRAIGVVSCLALGTVSATGLWAQPATDAQAEAPAVSFESGLVEGASMTFEIRRAIDYTEQMGDDESTAERTTESHGLRLSVEVTEARADNTFVVTGSFLAINSRVQTPEGPVSIAFDLEGDAPEMADELMGLDAMLPVLKDARFTLIYDINGNVTAVEGVPQLADTLDEETLAATPPGMMSLLLPETFGVLMSKLFNAEGGVERTNLEDAPGTTQWSTIENIELGPSGRMVITRSWTPVNAEGDAIEATGEFALSIEPAPVPNDGMPNGEIAIYRGTARLLWHPAGGLNYLTSTERIGMVWTLGADSVRSMQESATIIQRTDG